MALSPEDLARILGVPVDADDETVQRAYRTLAARYHPDRDASEAARARLEELNDAYVAWCTSRKGRAAPGAPAIDFEALFSSFSTIFGTAAPGATPTRGSDLSQQLRLAPSEALAGTRRVVDIARHVACEPCRGTGARDGALRDCAGCGGAGKLTQTHGFFRVESACADCKGARRVPIARCRVCDGAGLRAAPETITVVVPPDVRAGMVLRIPGKGGAHASAPGDLFLELVIADELAAFTRQGDDAVVEVEVGARLFLVGGALEVPTLDGKTTVRVPRGVADRHVVRIPGRGHPHSPGRSPSPSPSPSTGGPYRGESQQPLARGDQLVVLRVPPGSRTRARATVLVATLAAAGTVAAIWLG